MNQYNTALVDIPQNWIVIPLNSHQLSKHGSYPMGVGMVRCRGDVGEDVRDGGPHKRNYKLTFWKEDFSLLKFLYGKHRFVKFLGLERGGPTKGSKLLLPKVCGCLQQSQPSYSYFIFVH